MMMRPMPASSMVIWGNLSRSSFGGMGPSPSGLTNIQTLDVAKPAVET